MSDVTATILMVLATVMALSIIWGTYLARAFPRNISPAIFVKHGVGPTSSSAGRSPTVTPQARTAPVSAYRDRGTVEGRNQMVELDRDTARALVEVGYMSLKEYTERFGSAAQGEPAHIESPSTAPDTGEGLEPLREPSISGAAKAFFLRR